MGQIYLTRLEYSKGNSDKFYEVTVTFEEDSYETRATYGRIGSNGQIAIKYEGNNKTEALLVAAALVNSKEAKGYKVVKTVTSEQKKTAPKAVEKKVSVEPEKKKDLEEDRFSNLDI